MKMDKHPIYIVDDDEEDHELLQEIWSELDIPNELVFYTEGRQLINQLKSNSAVPFIIICDLNLPRMDGFEIREILYNDPETRYKTVPFIFWSNSAVEMQIKKAYDLGAHGMFIKGSNAQEIKNTFIKIVDYWKSSLKPK
jgi:CheY-like chemotaxis protein